MILLRVTGCFRLFNITHSLENQHKSLAFVQAARVVHRSHLHINVHPEDLYTRSFLFYLVTSVSINHHNPYPALADGVGVQTAASWVKLGIQNRGIESAARQEDTDNWPQGSECTITERK